MELKYKLFNAVKFTLEKGAVSSVIEKTSNFWKSPITQVSLQQGQNNKNVD